VPGAIEVPGTVFVGPYVTPVVDDMKFITAWLYVVRKIRPGYARQLDYRMFSQYLVAVLPGRNVEIDDDDDELSFAFVGSC